MLTEKRIQQYLTNEFVHNRKHKISVPNVYLYKWESDLLTINKDDYITEYEIKLSRWDYLRDSDKTQKFKSFNLLQNLSELPNYFYYVCPDKMIKPEDIPEYAGLIYIQKYNTWFSKIIKKAPILHNEEFERWEDIVIKLSNKLLNQ